MQPQWHNTPSYNKNMVPQNPYANTSANYAQQQQQAFVSTSNFAPQPNYGNPYATQQQHMQPQATNYVQQQQPQQPQYQQQQQAPRYAQTLTYAGTTYAAPPPPQQQLIPQQQPARYAASVMTLASLQPSNHNPYAAAPAPQQQANVATYYASAPQQQQQQHGYVAPTRVPNLPPAKQRGPPQQARGRTNYHEDRRAPKRKRSPNKRTFSSTTNSNTTNNAHPAKPTTQIEPLATSPPPSPDKPEKSFVSVHSITTVEKQIVDLKSRYSNLHVVPDFVKAKSHWLNSVSTTANELPLQHYTHIECDNETGLITSGITSEPAALYQGIKHNAKVVIPLGSSDSSNPDSTSHFATQYKFLIGKKDRSGLMCIGAAWSPSDGADPLNDDLVLIKTAIRGVREYCDLDLSACNIWIKMLELQYFRPAETIQGKQYPEMDERTVIYLPLMDVKPKMEEFSKIWKEKQELLSKMNKSGSDAEMPKEPFLYATTQNEKLKNNMKVMSISLDGLLDYNLDDKLEKTFELSLFAESFHEMLQRKHAYELYSHFKQRKTLASIDDGEPASKKAKLMDHEADVIDLNLQPKEITVDKAPSPVEFPSAIIDALRYFDRQGNGYVKMQDIENAIHSLSLGISSAEVQSMLPTDDRIIYSANKN